MFVYYLYIFFFSSLWARPSDVQLTTPLLYSSLDIRTVVHLTATKFQSFMLSVPSFTVSYATNILLIVILNDFCLFSAYFCYEVIYVRSLELRVGVRLGRPPKVRLLIWKALVD
jgi:predicted MPP superfamily phosphohydrolase